MGLGTRITAIAIGLVLAAITAASVSAQPSPQEYQAMRLRGQALNVIYGLGKPDAMTNAEYRAALIGGTALNERNGLPVALGSDSVVRLYGTGVRGAPATEAPVSAAPASNGFDWADAAIGAGVAIGLVLLGAAGARTLRGHGHIPHVLHH